MGNESFSFVNITSGRSSRPLATLSAANPGNLKKSDVKLELLIDHGHSDPLVGEFVAECRQEHISIRN